MISNPYIDFWISKKRSNLGHLKIDVGKSQNHTELEISKNRIHQKMILLDTDITSME